MPGTAFRVPTPDGSVVDLKVRLESLDTADQIKLVIKKAPRPKGVIAHVEDRIFSTDFTTDGQSCIVDAGAEISPNANFVQVVAWYDPESGYSHRVTHTHSKTLERMLSPLREGGDEARRNRGETLEIRAAGLTKESDGIMRIELEGG